MSIHPLTVSTFAFLTGAAIVSTMVVLKVDTLKKSGCDTNIIRGWCVIGYTLTALIVVGAMGILLHPTGSHWTEALSRVLGWAILFLSGVLGVGMTLLYRGLTR